MIKVKYARDQVLIDYPISYRLGFPEEQWAHGGCVEGSIVDLCNTRLVPYRYNLAGWLLCQHGVPNSQLCVSYNEPGVIYGSTRYPTRYLYGFPDKLRWWGDQPRADLVAYIVGETHVAQRPDWSTGSLPRNYFQVLDQINNMKWALTPEGSSCKMLIEWRAYWLREICRIGGGIGVQIGQRKH